MVYKQATVNTIKTIVTIITSLLFALIIFRFYPAEEIGTYYFLLSIITLISVIVSIPYGSILYLIPEDKKGISKKYLGNIMLFTFFISFILLILILFFLNIKDFVIISFLGAFAVTTQLSFEIIFSYGLFKLALFSNILSNVIKVVGVIIGFLIGIKTGFFIFLVFSLSNLINFIPLILIAQFSTISYKEFHMFLDFLRKSKEGLYIYIINVLNYINLTIDTFMGGLFLSLFDLGIYNITANIMRYVINAIPSSLSFFIFPLLLTKGKNEQEILKISLIIMNIFILPFVVASIYPEPFVKLISGGYEEYSNILFYFLPAVIVCSIQYIIVRYNLAKKDFSFIKVFALTALINVILNYVLAVYLNLGIHGLAMATTFSLVIFTFVLLRNFKIIEYEYVIKTFIVGILLSIITYAITFNMLRAFDNEAKAFLYGFFAIFISFVINLILIYLIFRNEAGNLKQKIFILLHKIKNYALRRFTTS